MKRRIVTAFQRYILNPITRPLFGYLPGTFVLETTGRSSGRARRTPVGGHLVGDTLWVIAEHGLRANYVRNIRAEPAVRARVRGRWRTGRATSLPSDDARKRLRFTWNDLMIRLVGTELLTVRIDLDPEPSRATRA